MDKNEPGRQEHPSRRDVLKGVAATAASNVMRGGAILQSTIPATVLASLGVVAGSGAFDSASAMTAEELRAFWERHRKSPVIVPKVLPRYQVTGKRWALFKVFVGPEKREWLFTCEAEKVGRCIAVFVDEALAKTTTDEQRQNLTTMAEAAEIPAKIYFDEASGISSLVIALPNRRQIYVECSASRCTADEVPFNKYKEVPRAE